MDDTRVLVGTAATITGVFRDQHGEPAAPAAPVTVEVLAPDGNEVLPAGTATTSGDTPGDVKVSIPPAALLGVYVATWTDSNGIEVTTHHEVVGGFYASVADIRSHDLALADRSRYPDATIRAARQLVEQEFEGICGRAFIPRYRRAVLDVFSPSVLVLPEPHLRRVRSISTADSSGSLVAMDSATVQQIPGDDDGVIRVAGWPAHRVVVEWESGMDAPPADVLGAFYTRVRDVLNRDARGVPDRTSSFTSAENGTFSLIVPGQRGSVTGIPDVDVVLARYCAHALVR